MTGFPTRVIQFTTGALKSVKNLTGAHRAASLRLYERYRVRCLASGVLSDAHGGRAASPNSMGGEYPEPFIRGRGCTDAR